MECLSAAALILCMTPARDRQSSTPMALKGIPMPRSSDCGDIVAPVFRRSAFAQPSTASARFLVGRDAHGNWIVEDRQGLTGGLFASESAALHFAREACGGNPADVCQVPEGVVLVFGNAVVGIVH
jgi:hypothetical protein